MLLAYLKYHLNPNFKGFSFKYFLIVDFSLNLVMFLSIIWSQSSEKASMNALLECVMSGQTL